VEYATRAEVLTSWYFGESEELLLKYAWYEKKSENRTWPVGSLKPNDFGFFDLHGHVWTWCLDRYKPYPSPKGETAFEDREDEQLVISDADVRVIRGGSFLADASNLRSAFRLYNVPTYRSYYGFRPARTFTP